MTNPRTMWHATHSSTRYPQSLASITLSLPKAFVAASNPVRKKITVLAMYPHRDQNSWRGSCSFGAKNVRVVMSRDI